MRNVDRWWDRLAQAEVFGVSGQAHDLLIVELFPVHAEEVPAERALSREVATGEGLIDDDGGGRLGLGISRLEVAAGE